MEKREWMDVGGCEWMDGWSEVGYLVDKMDRFFSQDGFVGKRRGVQPLQMVRGHLRGGFKIFTSFFYQLLSDRRGDNVKVIEGCESVQRAHFGFKRFF